VEELLGALDEVLEEVDGMVLEGGEVCLDLYCQKVIPMA